MLCVPSFSKSNLTLPWSTKIFYQKKITRLLIISFLRIFFILVQNIGKEEGDVIINCTKKKLLRAVAEKLGLGKKTT